MSDPIRLVGDKESCASIVKAIEALRGDSVLIDGGGVGTLGRVIAVNGDTGAAVVEVDGRNLDLCKLFYVSDAEVGNDLIVAINELGQQLGQINEYYNTIVSTLSSDSMRVKSIATKVKDPKVSAWVKRKTGIGNRSIKSNRIITGFRRMLHRLGA